MTRQNKSAGFSSEKIYTNRKILPYIIIQKSYKIKLNTYVYRQKGVVKNKFSQVKLCFAQQMPQAKRKEWLFI
ncbi:hypothetical protein D3Z60_12795 [Lachnospiraceae bacterium]|nr:hypothetical protein [Lachnospiraceae bacterium]